MLVFTPLTTENMRDYKFTGTMRPVYPLSEKRTVPDHIEKPDYADHPQGWSQCESVREKAVKILTKEEIEGMRKVCRVSHTAFEGLWTDDSLRGRFLI
jgi:methionyl aminopeptidase